MAASSDPRSLLQALQDEIVQGSAGSAARACRLLDTAQVNGWLRLVEEHRVAGPGADSLLHLAALFHQGASAAGLLRALARLCPRLLAAQRDGEYRGQTALHITVSKGNLAGAAALLSEMDGLGEEEKEALLETRASGSKFVDTVMDGELALHVAGLTLNQAMVDLLLEHGARLDAVNSLGDTVLHALVRFAGRHPDRADKVVEMLNHLHARSCKKIRLGKEYVKSDGGVGFIGFEAAEGVGDQLSVWFLENNAGLTPLKLAAKVGAVTICSHILSLDGVYRLLDAHDGLFDTHLYDITELDPVTNRLWQAKRQKPKEFRQKGAVKSGPKESAKSSRSRVFPSGVKSNPKASSEHQSKEKSHSCWPVCCFPACCSLPQSVPEAQSVLEILSGVGATQAFILISTDVVRQIVKSKWHCLRGIYYIWMLAHLLFMVGLTFYAVYRPRVHTEDRYGNASDVFNVSSDSLSTSQRSFVRAWPWVSVTMSVLYLGFECVRTFCQRQAWHLRRLHHNGIYRLLLVAFSLFLIIDSLWYWFHSHDADSNVFLILALLTGGWFAAFFLRAWRKFSFFTILFQKVLVGDMFRFSIMILLELVAFSAAMYVAYLPTSSPPGLPEEFEDLWTSILTMFRLMLGLSDIEILSRAPAAWMAIGLYVLFVLLTYVLLLNSLIAMMSQTCALVSEDRDLQWHMQRLSVLLLLETLLPLRWRPLMGEYKACRRYSLKTGVPHQEGRYLKPVTSVQASYTDGKAILRRQNLVRTLGFGELTLKLAPANISTFSTSPLGHNTKGTIRRQGTLSSPQTFHPDLYNKLNSTFSEEEENIYMDQAENYNAYTTNKLGHESQTNSQTLIKQSSPQSPEQAAAFDERPTVNVIHSTPVTTRRRHNSERKNRRTQTESNKPLSRSYPDGMLRNQHHDPTTTRQEPSQTPVLHYLAVPGAPVLHPSNQLPNLHIGYMAPTAIDPLPQPIINGYSSHVVSNNFQPQAHPAHDNLQQERFLPHAYSAVDLRFLNNQPVPGLVPTVQQVNRSTTDQTISAPVYSQQGPSQAGHVTASPTVQFVDVNDLSTEA
ncbi:transient receptor potential cation channel subfamily V member 4-like [Elysia marginata]|uniref:Transient receptor potential cation channel subfamily V member 4-like n=1 Tax=Elysia marginata TaxID=1093978 RepID=A0AAV4J6S4_9GAST|nr:transient receptor potential cation channel subfamily V member 4-like [Elysia marginata]